MLSARLRALIDAGDVYWIETYGAWSPEGEQIQFKGHDDLRDRLQRPHWTGGIGDSWQIKVIKNTPENRAAVEAEGLRPLDAVEIDESLWKEDPPA